MLSRRRLLAAVLASGALPAYSQSRPRVVATFSILGNMVSEVAGDCIDLVVLVGPDTDAHTYQPRPGDARMLAAARAMVSNGLGFEGWIDRLAKAAPFGGLAIVATAGVPTLEATAGRARGPDPHCWQDVTRARRYVGNIAEGLVSSDAANATFYRERAAAYDRRLIELDRWVRGEIAKVPADKRKAITSHTAFRYFAEAYGVQIEAAQGYKTDSEPSAWNVAQLIRLVRQQNIKALFIENMTNPVLIDEVARESG
ncbi:MAG: zinc ABC transporter substrate-binding protein, partial [Alphaproteobacteria bacterium]|nr:zinc ABC transporter substrate-binding protein [Alphaproteobacteria bacterium]